MGKENEEIELAGPDRGEAWGATVRDKKRMGREREFQFRLTIDAQGMSEDERAVARTIVLLLERREQVAQVDDENAAFEKEVVEPIVQAATVAMDALTDLVDFVTVQQP